MKPLVSILIPAYNVEAFIADTIRSALSQTWQNKEIIVVDDGSTDQTLSVARQFASKQVKVITQANQGAIVARNRAFECCNGDYMQWLDADDLLAPDKIERQMEAAEECSGRRMLFSSGWAYFYHRPHKARFIPTALWCDLSPVEWLYRKLTYNLYMQTATWLASRELIETAGPWDSRLHRDQDGEFFCRVLLASEGTRFVPFAGVFYRAVRPTCVSYVGSSDKKKNSLLLSMRLHMTYLRSLEDSERVRQACLTYMQNWYHVFYPSRPDCVGELQHLAAQLHGRLVEPQLRWKYGWLKPVLGYEAAARAQFLFPQCKAAAIRCWDNVMHDLETRLPDADNQPTLPPSLLVEPAVK